MPCAMRPPNGVSRGEGVVEVQRVAIGRGLAEKLDRAVVHRKLLHCTLSDRDRHVARLLRRCAILQLMAVALDTLARPVRDLRISVTDRCNFRCVYCMPKEVFGKQFEFLRREQLLTFEEIERLTHSFAGMGVEKLRITGGEPLVRRGVDELIARLAAVPRHPRRHADHERLAAGAHGAAPRRRRPEPRDRVARLARRRDVPRDERRRLPRGRRARRHRRRARGRPRAGQGQHGRQARHERRTASSRWPSASAARA